MFELFAFLFEKKYIFTRFPLFTNQIKVIFFHPKLIKVIFII